MIEYQRKILSDQIKEREKTLELYRELLVHNSTTVPNKDLLIRRRKSELVLDFPFDIKPLQKQDAKKPDDAPHVKKILQKFPWATIDDLPSLTTPGYVPLSVPTTEEWLSGRAPVQEVPALCDIEQTLQQSNLQPNSQKIYKSKISSRIKKTKTRYPRKALYLLDNPAIFFEHLEKRCLERNYKENPLRAFHDLIEMRLLLYVNTPSTNLDKVTLADIVQQTPEIGTLHLDEESYVLPSAFIQLAHAVLSPTEPLIKKTVKERNRFVENIAKAAKIRRISPKRIQNTASMIC